MSKERTSVVTLQALWEMEVYTRLPIFTCFILLELNKNFKIHTEN